VPSHHPAPCRAGFSRVAAPRAPVRQDLACLIGSDAGHLNPEAAGKAVGARSFRGYGGPIEPSDGRVRADAGFGSADTLRMGSGAGKMEDVTPISERKPRVAAWIAAAALGFLVAGCDSGQIAAPTATGVQWTRITNPADLNTPYFPDWRGNRIVLSYSSGNTRHLATMNADGTGVVYLSSGTSERFSYAPRWVDDSTIIFATNRSGNFDIWTRDLVTDQLRQLTTFPQNEFDPAPRPGTTGMAFTDSSEFAGRIALIPDYNAATPELYYLTPPTLRSGQVDWDPSGQRVCFSADSTTNYRQIWVITLAPGDSTPVKLTSGPYIDSTPRFSPDGTKILFASDKRTGRPGVWTVPVTQPGQLSLVAFDDIGSITDTPCWSPDGTQVVVSSNGKGYARSLWKLSNLP